MRILPQAQRDAMYEIYNFCRCVDDIADSSGPRPQRLQQLNEWRAQVSALYRGKQGELNTFDRGDGGNAGRLPWRMTLCRPISFL